MTAVTTETELQDRISDLEAQNISLETEILDLQGEVDYWQGQAYANEAAIDNAYQNGFSDGRCEV